MINIITYDNFCAFACKPNLQAKNNKISQNFTFTAALQRVSWVFGLVKNNNCEDENAEFIDGECVCQNGENSDGTCKPGNYLFEINMSSFVTLHL